MFGIRTARLTVRRFAANEKLRPLPSRSFHSSPSLRWVTPQSLSTSDLRRESERRHLSVTGSRADLLGRIEMTLKELGGHDNGLTLDTQLAADKKDIEANINRIPENSYVRSHVAIAARVQEKLKKRFENDPRVSFENKKPFITIECRYSEMCSLRSEIGSMAGEILSNETIYCLPHNVALRLKQNSLQQLPRAHDVQIKMIRPQTMTETNAVLLVVEGESPKRMKACDALESLIRNVRVTQFDLPGFESYSPPEIKSKRRRRKTNNIDDALALVSPKNKQGAATHSLSDHFALFEGTLLYIDVRTRELLRDYQERIDLIASQTNTNIFVGTQDLSWLTENQIGIEGSEGGVSLARMGVDQLLNELKSFSTTLVVPPGVSEAFSLESKTISALISKKFGVDNVIVQDGDLISVQLVGTPAHVKDASMLIDTVVHRLNGASGCDRAHAERRERIRNLNFMAMGIGGLDDSLRTMMRRTFESRLISTRLRKELGLSHVRGVLMHGPPGTGKTLIARKIAELLGCKEPKIVNGPEVESKWVGEAEKNIRNLFEEARDEFEEKGDESELHIVIFDEIDAIAKKRGGAHSKARDGALNQLLCCLDGIDGLENVLVFGLTNRKDSLDPALLRPGRLEAQLEIGLPDAAGREDILKIHTKAMRQHDRLADDVDLRLLAQYAEDFSGADIAGMIRSATSFALENLEDEDEVVIDQATLERGLHEVRMVKDRLPTSGDEDVSSPGLLPA